MHCSCPMWTLSSLILLDKLFSRCRQFSYMPVLMGAKLCGSPELSLCVADLCQYPLLQTGATLASLNFLCLVPSTPGIWVALPEFSLLVHSLETLLRSNLGEFQGSPHLFPIFLGSLFFKPWNPVSSKLLFCIFCLNFICFTGNGKSCCHHSPHCCASGGSSAVFFRF